MKHNRDMMKKNHLALIAFCLLHGVLMAQSVLTLLEHGQSEYTIGLAEEADSLEKKAADELQAYLFRITGVRLPVGPVVPKGRWILVGGASRKPESADYAIRRIGKNLHISGKTPLQTLECVYVFLEKYAGCSFLAPDVEYIPQQSSIRVAADYHYTPTIPYRSVHAEPFFRYPDHAAKRRVSSQPFPLYAPEARVHTFGRFLPAARFFEAHPEYYALVNGVRRPTQLCLANDTVFQLVRDSVAAIFARNPEARIVSVSQDDNTQYCTCARCAASDSREGSPAGSMVYFVNRIARAFPERIISTLAYQYTRRAPRYVKPEKNVLITLCSIECDRSAPIAEKCRDFEQDLVDWGKTGAMVGIWDYTTQFTNFLAPFPNLHTLQPNLQLFSQHNTRWVFEQHSYHPSELFELRSFLLSSLLWDPYASTDSLTRLFIQRYYGEKAGPYIQRYVDTVHQALQDDKKFFLFLYGDPSQGFSSFLSAARLRQYDQWFDAALEAVGTDTVLQKRVQAARIGADFAMLEYYRRNTPDFPLSDTQRVGALLQRFEKSCRDVGAAYVNEMRLAVADYVSAYRVQIRKGAAQNLAKGAAVTLATKPKKYARENPQTLTDGAFGGWSFYANWLGFEGNSLEAVLDLGESRPIQSISTSFLQVVNHVVFFPDSVAYYFSEDGKDFRLLDEIPNALPLTPESKINDIQEFRTRTLDARGRYVKIVAVNRKTAPDWHYAAGLGAWIFADEVVVE